MRLAPTPARAAGCCAILLLSAGCPGKDIEWPPDDSSADDTAVQDDTADSGHTGETGDSSDPLDPCEIVPCDTSDGSGAVQLEEPFLGPYVWFCDAAQAGASYTIALDVEITAEDAAQALLQIDYDTAYVAATGAPPTTFTTGVPQDSAGRPLLSCTWDGGLGLFREERLTLRGG